MISLNHWVCFKCSGSASLKDTKVQEHLKMRMEIFKKASRGNNLFWQIQTSNRILRGGEQTSVGKCTHLACNCFCFKNIKSTQDVLSACNCFCFQIQNGEGTILEDFFTLIHSKTDAKENQVVKCKTYKTTVKKTQMLRI